MKSAQIKGSFVNLCISSYFLLTLLVACISTSTQKPLSTSLSPSKSISTNTIVLANGIWPPYNGPDLPHAGCDSWVIEEAFALSGITVKYEFFPWARSYNLSAAGEVDGTMAWADTPEHREQHYISNKPTSTQEWVFFYRIDHPFFFTTMDDLTGKTIGITTGYVYSDAFIELQEKGTANFIESSNDETNFRMLLAGRIDLFPMERYVGQYLLSTLFTAEEQNLIGQTTNSFSEFTPYLLLSKAIPENEERMELFNEGFQELVTSGRYAEIMDNCEPY